MWAIHLVICVMFPFVTAPKNKHFRIVNGRKSILIIKLDCYVGSCIKHTTRIYSIISICERPRKLNQMKVGVRMSFPFHLINTWRTVI